MTIPAEEAETRSTYGDPEFVKWFVADAASNYLPAQESCLLENLVPQGVILDVGCGAADHAILFPTEKYQYVGVDISRTMLEAARQRCPEPLFVMDMYTLALRGACIDGFWACASLHHFTKESIRAVLQEIYRVLKPCGGGMILIPWGEHEEMMVSKFSSEQCSGRALSVAYLLPEFSEILIETGFEIVEGWEDERMNGLIFYARRP